MRTRGPAARANAAHSPATGNGVGGDDDMDDLYGGDDDEDDDHVGRGVEARGTSGGGGGGGGVGGGVPGVQMIKVEGRDALPNTSPITHTAIVSSTTTTAILCANLCVCVCMCVSACVCMCVCMHLLGWLSWPLWCMMNTTTVDTPHPHTPCTCAVQGTSPTAAAGGVDRRWGLDMLAAVGRDKNGALAHISHSIRPEVRACTHLVFFFGSAA